MARLKSNRPRKHERGFFSKLKSDVKQAAKTVRRGVKRAMPMIQTGIDIAQQFAPAGFTPAIDTAQSMLGGAVQGRVPDFQSMSARLPQFASQAAGYIDQAQELRDQGFSMMDSGRQFASAVPAMGEKLRKRVRTEVGSRAKDLYGQYGSSPLSAALQRTSNVGMATARERAVQGSGQLARKLGQWGQI